ncbi:MAG: TonB-dependent receptor [Candidatus Eisenbacteria bacterium]
MRPVSFAFLLAVVAALLAAPFALAQNGTISGTVTDNGGVPVPDAIVRVEGTSLRATTNAAGAYEIAGVPAGTHTLLVGLIGYKPSKGVVTVEADGAANADFRLEGTPIRLAPTDVMVGSRAPHTAADELAVPVDVYTSEEMAKQGSTETGQILQALAPSVNFPRQSVTDATDIVRPFTLRGLSPDHTLVLIDGARRHQTAVVNTFAYGTNAGSSGVDMNALPSSAIDRIEVLRDGASAQYGSDAIAGVVNVVTKKGRFTPFVNVTSGRYTPDDYGDDGTTVNVNGGWGLKLGTGSLALFGEFLDRQPTNRAWADPYDASGNGVTDSVNSEGQVVLKRNAVPQPNHHWGDGLEKDVLTYATLDLPLNDRATSQLFAHGGYSFRRGTGNGYRRYADSDRNWPEIYPLGYLPEFRPDVKDYSAAGGIRSQSSGWALDFSGSVGHNDFDYNLRNTMNVSLGPSLGTATAPGTDGIPGNSDDPGIPNQTSFFAGRVARTETIGSVNASKAVEIGLPRTVNLAVGAAFRREAYKITQGERASWIDGGDTTQYGGNAPGGSQVFPGFSPSDETDADRTNFGTYLDLETNLTEKVLANVAGRFENYNDFGSVVTGKAAFRLQPSERLTLRAAGSTGFRAPGLGQIHFSKVVTNFIGGVAEDIGVFPVEHPAARALGSKDLKEESSVNLSAGMAWSPRANVTITADVFQIKLKDRIILGATFDDDSTRAILTAAGYSDIAGVQYFTNGLDTKTKGIDLTGDWKVVAGPGRTVGFTGSVNYTKNEITRVDPLPAVLQDSEETGLLDVVTRVAIEEERPDWRGTVAAEYVAGAFRMLGRASYFGKFASAQPGYCDACREEYGSKTLIDTEAGYRFAAMELSAGVRNLFDTYPDKATDDYNNNFGTFPWAAASPFGYNGRYVYVRSSFALTR